MRRLFHVVAAHKAFAVLSVCVVASLVLLSLDHEQQAQLARVSSLLVFDVGQRVFSGGVRVAHLWHENEALRRENLRLSLELGYLREAALENGRLRTLLAFPPRPEYDPLPTSVIGRNADRASNCLVIGAGERQGVRSPMPVVTSGGLVGRVLEVNWHSAVVQTLLDPGCRVSAVVQTRERAFGIVQWTGQELVMEVPAQSSVVVGDSVVSTGLGRVFPKGMVVGMVSSIEPPRLGLTRRLVVAPAVDFDRVEEVFVLRRVPPLEFDGKWNQPEAAP